MKRKILFINPNITTEKIFIDYPYFVNLGMLQMVSILEDNGYEVDVIDMFAQEDSDAVVKGDSVMFGSKLDINEIVRGKNLDLVIILNSPFLKLFSSKINKNIQGLLNAIKSNETEIILADCYIGGMHYVDYDFKEIIKKYPLIDKVCKHECDTKLVSLIEGIDLKGDGNFCQTLNEIPFPNYDSISMDNYFNFLKKVSKKGFSPFFSLDKNTMGIFTSRGCIHNCIFCSSRLQGRTYRAHSLDYVRKHLLILKEKYGVNKVIILDELGNPNEKRLDDLLRLLSILNLNYEFPNGLRADNISEKGLLMMKDKISMLFTSAESGCPRIVNEVIKKNLKLSSIDKLAELCAERKIPLAVHFMIGLPKESYENINKTLNYAIELVKKYGVIPLIQLAIPIPGSEFFTSLKLGRLQEQDLLDNYFSYFLKGNKFSDISFEDLDMFVQNFDIRMNVKEIEKIIINVNYACNNNCVFCAVGNWRDKKSSLELQKRRLKGAYSQGIRMVDFDGGEPTLDKNLLHLIKYSKALGFENSNLITNGRLLSIKENANKIIKAGVTSVLFSLHGSNTEIHEQVTQAEGSFEQTIQGIKNILEINKQTKNSLNVGVNITLTNRNIFDLDNFFRIVKNMGIKKINIQFITPFGLAREEHLPKKKDIAKIIPEIIDKYSKDIKIQIVNLPFCYIKGYETYLLCDILKLKRNMMFIGIPEQNLSEFLASKRYKDKECSSCVYNIICGGKWNFSN